MRTFIIVALILIMTPLASWADTLRYQGSGRITSLDFKTAKITINNKQYAMDPYSFKAEVDGRELQLEWLKEGAMVKYYVTKTGTVALVKIVGSSQYKRQLLDH